MIVRMASIYLELQVGCHAEYFIISISYIFKITLYDGFYHYHHIIDKKTTAS